MFYFDENMVVRTRVRITSGIMGMYKDLFKKFEEKSKYQKQGV